MSSVNLDDGNFTQEHLEAYIREGFIQERYDIIALYVPVFLSALIANVLVIWVVIRDHYMRSVTNYFLVNLSIADLLVTLICMPEAAIKAYKSNYDLGRYPCKVSSYLQCIAVSASIFTITAMALDRYLAISRPFARFYTKFNKKTTVFVIVLLWLTAIILLFPMFLIVDLVEDPIHYANVSVTIEMCHENWDNFDLLPRQTMGIVWFVCMFAIPGAIMLYGYSMMGKILCSVEPPLAMVHERSPMQQRIRSRRRVACILLLLAFIFAVCWLPYHTFLLLLDMNEASDSNDGAKGLNTYFLLLGHANSALNPIVYCALSRRFRKSIKDLLYFKIECTRRNSSMQWADSSASGTQMNYWQRIKSAPQNKLHMTLTRLTSSQKTKSTKTCAV